MRVAGPLSYLWDDGFVAGRLVSIGAMWEVEQAMGWLRSSSRVGTRAKAAVDRQPMSRVARVTAATVFHAGLRTCGPPTYGAAGSQRLPSGSRERRPATSGGVSRSGV